MRSTWYQPKNNAPNIGFSEIFIHSRPHTNKKSLPLAVRQANRHFL